MSEPWGKLRIHVVDDEIHIDLPGTTDSVIYYKPANSPQLLARNISHEDDKRTPLARAWQEANDKARELGWIV